VVSVIIPTYNASRYLDAQLRAVRAQTMKALDILVIDSSSSDKTLDTAKQHAIQTVTIPKVKIAFELLRHSIIMRMIRDGLSYISECVAFHEHSCGRSQVRHNKAREKVRELAMSEPQLSDEILIV